MARMSAEQFELAVVGAGPGGISAAARAAEQGMSHVLLESAEKHANTVQQYQHHKHVMAEPSVLPLRSDVAFCAGRREEILAAWQQAIETSRVNIRYRSEVTGIEGSQGNFTLKLKGGAAIRARHVILALGVQGNPRQIGVPGGELPCVQYTLESALALRGERIIVIGAGDAAIENAISLAKNNRVTLLNRGNGFPRAKEGNASRALRAIAAGQIACVSDSRPKSLARATAGSVAPYVVTIDTPNGPQSLPCHRIIARLGAIPTKQLIEGAGAKFLSDATDAAPELSARYESTVAGLYVIGALAGFPLIKQAMNQGFEVVEHLLGRTVKPADHEILAAVFRRLRNGHDVEATMRKIHGTVRVFRDVKELALRELMLSSTILTPAKGTQLFTRGVYSSSVFNILRGEVHLGAGDGSPMTLRAGQLLGEMALISGRPHEMGAVAGADCVVLETPHSAMRKLVRSEQSVRAYIDKVYALRALRVFLMPHASPQTVAGLSEGVQLHRIKAGEALFRQGEPFARFYLVRSGSVSLTRKSGEERDAVIAYGAAGAYLDAAGCLAGESVRSMSAVATVTTEALSIDQAQFRRLIAADALIKNKLQAESAQQLTQQAHMQAQPQAGKVFSYLMSHGLGEATSVLVIDEDLCVGCDQCEKACAATHDGVSRLDRSAGPSLFSLHLPTSCRHCEHPHCMQDCPPNAIHRLPDGEVSIADTCIGCGNCVENCPYGVIQLAQVAPKTSFLSRIGRRAPKEVAKTAVKCDSCASLKGGPACVRACPTGAAIRIHAEDVLKLAKQRAVAAQQ